VAIGNHESREGKRGRANERLGSRERKSIRRTLDLRVRPSWREGGGSGGASLAIKCTPRGGHYKNKK